MSDMKYRFDLRTIFVGGMRPDGSFNTFKAYAPPKSVNVGTPGHIDHAIKPFSPREQAMPQTVEAYKKLAARDLELIMEQKEEISRLKQKVNNLRQKLDKRAK